MSLGVFVFIYQDQIHYNIQHIDQVKFKSEGGRESPYPSSPIWGIISNGFVDSLHPLVIIFDFIKLNLAQHNSVTENCMHT